MRGSRRRPLRAARRSEIRARCGADRRKRRDLRSAMAASDVDDLVAIAGGRAEHIAGKAVRMDAHQRRSGLSASRPRAMSPRTSATCSSWSTSLDTRSCGNLRSAWAARIPRCAGRSARAACGSGSGPRRSSVSARARGRIRSSCGMRAMVPSSFMISQITPEGSSPAMRARSTDASVCPARTSTPPLRARSV